MYNQTLFIGKDSRLTIDYTFLVSLSDNFMAKNQSL